MMRRVPYPQDMQLIILGTRHADGGEQAGAELWRVPFRGWDETHRLRAEAWCEPKRYIVADGPLVRADGYIPRAVVFTGEIFSLSIGAPPAP